MVVVVQETAALATKPRDTRTSMVMAMTESILVRKNFMGSLYHTSLRVSSAFVECYGNITMAFELRGMLRSAPCRVYNGDSLAKRPSLLLCKLSATLNLQKEIQT